MIGRMPTVEDVDAFLAMVERLKAYNVSVRPRPIEITLALGFLLGRGVDENQGVNYELLEAIAAHDGPGAIHLVRLLEEAEALRDKVTAHREGPNSKDITGCDV